MLRRGPLSFTTFEAQIGFKAAESSGTALRLQGVQVPGLSRVFLRSDGTTVYDTLSLSSTPIREFLNEHRDFLRRETRAVSAPK